jgi:hypothetical protein
MKVFLILSFILTSFISGGNPQLQWGHWVDSDSDCLNTRHELLARESLEPVIYKTVKNCNVITGKWYGPYLGKFFTVSSDFDHVIPLKWAHIHGGWRWSKDLKREFANDYLNLVLVDKGRNRSKGAKGPGEWMPDNSAYHFDNAFRWSYLVGKYNLSVNQVDGDKISEVANSCCLN